MTSRSVPSILLAYPSCFHYPGHLDRIELRSAQLLLASYLAQYYPVTYADFEVTIGRPNTPSQIRRYGRKVRQLLETSEFDILALSCWTSLSYQATLVTARICRELYPERTIVVGGYHPTALPQDFVLDDNCIDYVVCGEGELAMRQIAEDVSARGRPESTTIVKASTFTADRFVPYNWDLVERLITEHHPDGLPNLYMYLSRGCPFGCSFCMEPLKDRSWRAYTPEQAVEMMNSAVARFNSRAVAISDACFGMRPAWRKEFLRLLVDNATPYWLIFETRPEYLDDADLDMLAELKVEVQFGIESGAPRILELMKKTRQPEKFLERFYGLSNRMSDRKILHRANLIFNHPGETPHTLEETFAYMDRFTHRTDSYLMWACHGYMHFPGCDLDRNRSFYEESFGTRILRPVWWKEDHNQYESSLQAIPSDQFDESTVKLWETMYQERESALRGSLAPEALDFATRKYFPEWEEAAHAI